MTAVETAIADTSLFIAQEQGRAFRCTPPRQLAVSIITVGELRAGVLAAPDGKTRAQRLRTVTAVAALDPIPVDDAVASAWAELRLSLRDAGKRMPLNDSWIAATALAHDLPLATQDDDYDVVPGLRLVKL